MDCLCQCVTSVNVATTVPPQEKGGVVWHRLGSVPDAAVHAAQLKCCHYFVHAMLHIHERWRQKRPLQFKKGNRKRPQNRRDIIQGHSGSSGSWSGCEGETPRN